MLDGGNQRTDKSVWSRLSVSILGKSVITFDTTQFVSNISDFAFDVVFRLVSTIQIFSNTDHEMCSAIL